MSIKKIRIGTRSTPMSLVQAHYVENLLKNLYPLIEIEIKTYISSGDKFLESSLVDIGGKGLFTKEIELALLRREIDIAIHCAKDMPTHPPKDLIISATLPAEDPRDCLVSTNNHTLFTLPPGSCIGTASLRRQAYIKRHRPDLIVKILRGAVATRIKKLETPTYDAAILSFAGLKRLNLSRMSSETFDPTEWIPAIGQGILVIQTHSSCEEIKKIINPLNCKLSAFRWKIERLFMETLDGSCKSPIAGYACLEKKDEITFHGMVGNSKTLLFAQKTLTCSTNDILEKIIPFAQDLKKNIPC